MTENARENWLIKILILILVSVLLFSVRHLLSPPIVAFLVLLVLFPERGKNWAKPFIFLSSIVLILWVISQLKLILIPFILAFVVSYIMHPIVQWLQKRKIPKIIAIIMVELTFVALIALFLILLVPILINEINNFIKQVPQLVQWGTERLEIIQKWLDNIGIKDLKINTSDVMDIGIQELQGGLKQARNLLILLVSTVWYSVMALVISFFYLKDQERITDFIKRLIPSKQSHKVKFLTREIDSVLGLYIRGQLIVSILDGLIVGIGLSLMGVRYAALLGVLAAIFSIIPNFGFLFTVLVTLLVTISGPNPVVMSIKAGIIFVIEEILLTLVITPNVMGGSMGLNPLVIMLALLTGASLFGVPGLILAAPVTAVLTRLYYRYIGKKDLIFQGKVGHEKEP
ncbi:MAG: hypothetical protein APR63_06540 [Desulfuromonas sp. SDB]|nr:MAG: hypothetical protein APR63_06540 [Desulfuromonas sp. SDB]